MAHGPGDASMLRGLHGELEFIKPMVASTDLGPPVQVEPWLENWSRRHGGRTYVVAATTRGIAFGHWRAGEDSSGPKRCGELATGMIEKEPARVWVTCSGI